MGKEFLITDFITKEALDQLSSAKAKLLSIGKEYASLSALIASGIKVNPSTLESITAKQTEYITLLKELHVTQNKLSESQTAYDKLLKSISEQTSKNVDQLLAEAKANDLLASKELKNEKAKTEVLKQEKLLNQESRQRKYTIKEGIAALGMEVKSLRDAEAQNKTLRAAKKDVDLTTKEGRETMQRFNTVIDKNTELIKKNSDSLVRSKMNVGRYKEDIKSAASEIMKGNVSIKNMGDLAKSTGGYLKSNMGNGFTEVRVGVGSMIKGMVGAQAVIAGIQKLIGLFKSGINTIIDFEAANSKLAAVLGTTSKHTKELAADARKLGAATKYTASEATNLQIELAKLGFSRKEILESTEHILRFAQATGAELPEAAALAGASLRMFGADTKETERYVSAMAVATTKSALSFSYLQTAMPIAGSVAKTYGFEIEEVLALLGKLADSGIDASSAATATRNIFLNLANGGGKLNKAMGGNIRTLDDFVKGLKKVKDNGTELAGMLEMTDKRSVNAFSNFVAGADSLLLLKKSITGVNKELEAMADTMGDNVAGASKSLASAWDDFSLSFSKSTGPMKDFLNWLATKIRDVAYSIKSVEEISSDVKSGVAKSAEKTGNSERLFIEAKFNSDYKKLMDAGHEEEVARNKAIALLSAERIEISGTEYKELRRLEGVFEMNTSKKKKAINRRDGFWSGMWDAMSFGMEDAQNKARKSIEQAVSSQKQYMDQLYTISVNEVKNKVIDDFIETNAQKSTKEDHSNLTEEEKKNLEKQQRDAEKAAKERMKILETHQQSELDLMDDGLDKELAKISFNYTKKMAAVKGQSEEEIATRQNIAEEMKRAIEDKTASYGIAKEQKDIANKLEAVKKGSKEEFDLRVEQLELQRDIETTEAIKTGEDIFAIDEKYNAKRTELIEKFANEQNKKLQEGYSVRSIISNQEMEKELSNLAGEYTKGLINKEKYEEEKLKIQQKYAIKQAKLAIEVVKLQLETGGLSEEDEMAIRNKIANAEMALAKLVTDTKISEMEREDDVRKKKLKNWEDGLAMVGDALNAFSDLGSAIYDRKIEEVEGEQEANDEAGQKEIDRITHLEETGVISKEEAEARKRAAEQKTATKEAELAKKKADLQTKQAKMEKANAIAQCIIQTALAAIKVWGQTGIGGIALAPLVIALGAIQLATIVAQPIPKYAKGTDNHPGGFAIVGDGGREEMIISGGKSWITPSVPTLVDIPRGSMVLPDVVNLESVRGMKSDVMLLTDRTSRRGDPITVNVNNDFRKLEGEMKNMSSSFNQMARAQRKASVQADLRNIANRL